MRISQFAYPPQPPKRTALHTLIRDPKHFANCVRYIRRNPRQLPKDTLTAWESDQAKKISAYSANTHPCKLSCAWHSLSIIESIGRKRFGSEAIHLLLRNLLDTFTVPSAGTDEAKQAFNCLAGDFEDALQISAAVASKADHILTNDASGFTKSPISVLAPKEFLLMLASGD